MAIILKSDFYDFYDHWFLTGGEYWAKDAHYYKRMSKDLLSKAEQFYLMEQLGFRTPMHGYVQRIEPDDVEDPYVVVYRDQYAHRGEGKELVPFWKALKYSTNFYCSLHISTTIPMYRYDLSRSHRFLYIGDRIFHLMYKSDTSWKSNTDPTIIFIGEVTDRTHEYPLKNTKRWPMAPVYAVDTVSPLNHVTSSPSGCFAIDFNSAPQMRGTPIEDMLEAREVYDLIEAWFERNNSDLRKKVLG